MTNEIEQKGMPLTRREALKRLLLGGVATTLGSSVTGCATKSAPPPARVSQYHNAVAYTNSIAGSASVGSSYSNNTSPYSRSSYTPYNNTSYSNSRASYINFAPYTKMYSPPYTPPPYSNNFYRFHIPQV